MGYTNRNQLQVTKRKFKTDMKNKNVDIQVMYEQHCMVGAPVFPHFILTYKSNNSHSPMSVYDKLQWPIWSKIFIYYLIIS